MVGATREGLAGTSRPQVAYIAQSAAAAFNPSRTIMAQVIESALIHGTAIRGRGPSQGRRAVPFAGHPEPETIGRAIRIRSPAASCSG